MQTTTTAPAFTGGDYRRSLKEREHAAMELLRRIEKAKALGGNGVRLKPSRTDPSGWIVLPVYRAENIP